MKQKNPKPSIAAVKKIKKVNRTPNPIPDGDYEVKLIFLGEYFNVHTMQSQPISLAFIQKEAKRLRDWAMLDSSIRLVDFIDEAGYNPKIFYGWCAKWEFLDEARQFANRRIGSRREQGAMTRQFAESTIHRTLGYYDDIWASETIKIAKMREELAAQNETKIVVIERFPSLDQPDSTEPERLAMEIHNKTKSSSAAGAYVWKEKS